MIFRITKTCMNFRVRGGDDAQGLRMFICEPVCQGLCLIFTPEPGWLCCVVDPDLKTSIWAVSLTELHPWVSSHIQAAFVVLLTAVSLGTRAHHGCLLMKPCSRLLFRHTNFFFRPLLWILSHLLPRRVFYHHGVVPVEGDRHHAGELSASLHPQVPAQTLLAAQLLQAHLVDPERSHVCDQAQRWTHSHREAVRWTVMPGMEKAVLFSLLCVWRLTDFSRRRTTGAPHLI